MSHPFCSLMFYYLIYTLTKIALLLVILAYVNQGSYRAHLACDHGFLVPYLLCRLPSLQGTRNTVQF